MNKLTAGIVSSGMLGLGVYWYNKAVSRKDDSPLRDISLQKSFELNKSGFHIINMNSLRRYARK